MLFGESSEKRQSSKKHRKSRSSAENVPVRLTFASKENRITLLSSVIRLCWLLLVRTVWVDSQFLFLSIRDLNYSDLSCKQKLARFVRCKSERTEHHWDCVCNIHKVQQASCCFGWLAQVKQSKAKASKGNGKQCEMQCRLRSWMYRAHHTSEHRTQNWSSKQQFDSVRAVSQLSDTVSKRRSCVFAKNSIHFPDISFAVQLNRTTRQVGTKSLLNFNDFFSTTHHQWSDKNFKKKVDEMCTNRRKLLERQTKFNRRLKMA